MTFDLQNYTYNGYKIIMEFWEPITDEIVPNIKPIYFISSIGNVYNSKTNKYSNITLVPGRYPSVTLQLNNDTPISMDIHRLVCMAFHGMPPKANYEVDYVNCNNHCTFKGDLEWVTRQENQNRAYINNLIKSGEDNYRAILSNDDIELLYGLLMQHLPINNICNIMKNRILPRVYPSGFKGLISHILQKDVWKKYCV